MERKEVNNILVIHYEKNNTLFTFKTKETKIKIIRIENIQRWQRKWTPQWTNRRYSILMKRTSLSFKDLNKELTENNLNIQYTKQDTTQLLETPQLKHIQKIILINNQPSFFYYTLSEINNNTPKQLLIPTIKLLQTHSSLLKSITIDMNAIKFIINGADVMRPGITNIDDNITKDQPICIIDITHKKPLAIGISLHSTEQLRTLTTGKVIKNIHYVGDELWKVEMK